jgi:ferritin-like metal-binding protein YciE
MTMAAKSKSSRSSRKEVPDGTELLVLELQEIHSAESQLARVLPRVTKAVESENLRKFLELRLEQGERLIEELETALEELDESPGRKKNVAAEGLINDMREHIQEIAQSPSLDAVLIGALQKTEHYCVAAWGTAKALGQAMEQKTVVRSMERALKEGKSLDEELTQLAEREVTPAILSQASGDEDSDSDGKSARRGSRSENEKRV